MTTQETIIRILRDYTDPEQEITAETSLSADLNLDSLDMVELVMTIEEELDLPWQIDDEAAESCRTVGDVFKLIEGKEGH